MKRLKNYRTIWRPQPKQEAALTCPATELFFGGAAGGGKSDFLLMDWVQMADEYGKYASGILFRQTNPQLEELQKRARELYTQLGAVYHGQGSKENPNSWVFPNGAVLKMRYLESDDDVENYQGHQYTWIGMDELGNYPTPYCWEYMTSRLRSAHGVPCFIRGSANPGGRGHSWIKQRFMDNQQPNRIFYKQATSFEGKVLKNTVCFIPSRLEDNQILMQADPDYEARLMNLPAHLARALRYGDWTVFEGQIFDVFRYETHVVKPFPLDPGTWFKFCAMDWGFSRPAAIYWMAVNAHARVVVYKEWYLCKEGEFNVGLRMGAKEVAKTAWEMCINEGVIDMVADPAIWGPNQVDQNGPSIADIFEEAGFRMHKGNHDRKSGLIRVYDYLKEGTEESEGKVPMLTFFPSCKAAIRTFPMLTPNPNDQEDVDTDLEDHPYDAIRYGLMSDFVAHPIGNLRRQNGKYERMLQENQKPYDPFENI